VDIFNVNPFVAESSHPSFEIWEILTVCVAYKNQVKNPSENKEVVEITNYIDFGLEFTGRPQVKECYSGLHKYYPLTPFSYCFRIDKDKPEKDNSLFQLAASWQANKNFLLKVSKSIHLGHHD
jgi:hypothetical protein